MRVALVRGPFLRASGVQPWERLHATDDDIDVTAFTSEPPKHDPSEVDLPVESLPWYDGKLSLLGYDHFVFSACQKFDLPRALLGGVGDLALEYDVIHTSENFNLFSAQAARACQGTDTKFAFAAGENIPFYPPSIPTHLHKSYVNERVDGATTTTIEGKRALIHEGLSHEKVSVVPNAIDLSTFAPEHVSPAALDLPSSVADSFTVAFVHRLCEQKGTPYLIEAFERLQETVADTSLVLVGADMLDDETTRRRIDENDDIHHLPRVPYEDITDVYNLADVFALPSVTMAHNEEQFGMALIEAMACETPSVVTSVGGLPHVAERGETSLVVEERSPETLHEAFERLHADPDLRRTLGTNARRRVRENFREQVVADRLAAFYRSL